MLEIQGLTKYYRNTPVVDDVSFTVRPGEVTGYLGPNGSGKSTTVKSLAATPDQAIAMAAGNQLVARTLPYYGEDGKPLKDQGGKK